MNKKCNNCGEEKFVSEYYKHPKTKDGYQGICKDCQKERSRNRDRDLRKDKSYVESERIRAREKYQRLNYKDRQKELDSKRPWKKLSKYRNMSRKFKTKKGYELHHWSYNEDHIEDLVVMTTSEHKKAHRYLLLNNEKMMFISDKGEILDTKEKHLKYLKDKNVNYEII